MLSTPYFEFSAPRQLALKYSVIGEFQDVNAKI